MLEVVMQWVALVCGAIVGVSAAFAIMVKLGRWAYIETKRRHALDRVVRMEETLAVVAKAVTPNGGESMFDRITQIACEQVPDLASRIVNVEAYVEELKGREARAPQRTHRQPDPPTMPPYAQP